MRLSALAVTILAATAVVGALAARAPQGRANLGRLDASIPIPFFIDDGAGIIGYVASDRDLAKKIRQAVVGDKTLSTYAHNVKIVAQDGQVTLKGPVRSEAEKTAIEVKATEIAGAGKVTNDITIAPEDAPKKPKS